MKFPNSLCVGEDDEDEEAYKKQRKQQQQQQQQRAARSRGILDEEERPESTLSGSTAEDEPGAGPADGGDAIDVSRGRNSGDVHSLPVHPLVSSLKRLVFQHKLEIYHSREVSFLSF